MDRLPPDVLDIIVGFLPTRAVCALACVGRDYRAAAGRRDRLAVAWSPTWSTFGAMEWAARASNAPRVWALKTARLCPQPYRLRTFCNLRTLTIQYTSLDRFVVDSLPATLEHVALHRLLMPTTQTFDRLLALPNLVSLEVTCAAALPTIEIRAPPSSKLLRLSVRGGSSLRVLALPQCLRRLSLGAYICVHMNVAEFPPALEALAMQSLFAGDWPVSTEPGSGLASYMRLPASLRDLVLRSTADDMPAFLEIPRGLRNLELEYIMMITGTRDLEAMLSAERHVISLRLLPIVMDVGHVENEDDEGTVGLFDKLRVLPARKIFLPSW